MEIQYETYGIPHDCEKEKTTVYTVSNYVLQYINASSVTTPSCAYVMVVTWAWVICLICMSSALGPRASGIHIRQIPHGHVTTNKYHFVPIVTTPVV